MSSKYIPKYDNKTGVYNIEMKEAKKFKVYDWLELVTVGYADTWEMAKAVYKAFVNDTDGECDLQILYWNDATERWVDFRESMKGY